MTRPIAQGFTFTTGIGSTWGNALFGTGFGVGSILFTNPSTQSIKGTVQSSLGGSGVWVDLITLSTLNTVGGTVSLNATSTGVFDRLRVDLTANDLSDTGTSGIGFWLGAR